MKIFSRVGIFIMRKRAAASAELLLFMHVDHPKVPLQIPGGDIKAWEEPYAAALRELHEEAGIRFLPLVRALGVSEARSVVHPDLTLRRHCYLFDGAGLPDSWMHGVSGIDGGKDLYFEYRWHGIAPDFRLPGDLHYFLNRDALPELFEAELQ